MPWFKRKTAAGAYRLENEQGHVLHDESNNPIEFDDAAPAQAGVAQAPAQPAGDAGEVDRLKAEVARLKADAAKRAEDDAQAARAKAKADAQALADRLAAGPQARILPAQKAAVARTYETLARADLEAGTDEAGTYAKSFDDAPPLGLTAARVEHQGAAAPPPGTPPAGALPHGGTPGDPMAAAGLDDASLRALIARGPDGPRLLARLDKGELSWDQVRAVAAAQLPAAR